MPHLRANADRAGLLPRNIRELNHRQEVSLIAANHRLHTPILFIHPRRFPRIIGHWRSTTNSNSQMAKNKLTSCHLSLTVRLRTEIL